MRTKTTNLFLLIPKDAIQIIGIDPGVKTGIAVWDRSKKYLTKMATLDIDKAWQLVQDYYSKDRSIILIENPNLRTYYGKNPFQKMQGAGSIKRDWSVWQKRLKDAGMDYIPVAPQDFQSIDNHEVFCKWVNQHFSRTSVHSRDAAMMVYKR